MYQINVCACACVCVSIPCVPLILGRMAYSSNQADVRDLFWMPSATAGQQQQQEQEGKECRLSGGLSRMIGDPVEGSGDGGSPVSWVVEEREGASRARASWTGDVTLMREKSEKGGGAGGGGGGGGGG